MNTRRVVNFFQADRRGLGDALFEVGPFVKAFAELWLNRMIALERLIGGGFAVRVLLVASSLVITLAATSQSPFAQSSNPEESAAQIGRAHV